MFFCEIHRKLFNNFSTKQTCCDAIFDKRPIFTAKGICFSTNTSIFEHYPYTFSAIKIWTDALKGKVVGKFFCQRECYAKRLNLFFAEYEMVFKGSEALEKDGIYFAIGDLDHPAGTLMESYYPTSALHSYNIGLRKVVVSIF